MSDVLTGALGSIALFVRIALPQTVIVVVVTAAIPATVRKLIATTSGGLSSSTVPTNASAGSILGLGAIAALLSRSGRLGQNDDTFLWQPDTQRPPGVGCGVRAGRRQPWSRRRQVPLTPRSRTTHDHYR